MAASAANTPITTVSIFARETSFLSDIFGAKGLTRSFVISTEAEFRLESAEDMPAASISTNINADMSSGMWLSMNQDMAEFGSSP